MEICLNFQDFSILQLKLFVAILFSSQNSTVNISFLDSDFHCNCLENLNAPNSQHSQLAAISAGSHLCFVLVSLCDVALQNVALCN